MKVFQKRFLTGLLAATLFLFLMALSWLAEGESGPGPGPFNNSPRRIVSLAPSVTEVLFGLGLDERIVGVTDFCDHPEEAKSKPRVGGFKGHSLEAIIGLSPDLVIGTGDGNEAALFRALERLDVKTLSIQPATLTGVIESVRTIGKAVGREREAETMARDMETKLVSVSSKVSDAKPVKVLFVYGRNPLVLAGPGTFADDMIRWAGGENVAHDAHIPYPRFSMETVMARSPDVIVEGVMGSEGAERQRMEARKFWKRWESIPAAENDRVELLDEDLIARPGPRIFDGLEKLARVLHPERFGEK